jgi:hypothetical protein
MLRIRMFLGLLDPYLLVKRYGSGSFHHQAKIVRKTLIPTVLRLHYDFLYLKNYVNVPSKSRVGNEQKKTLNVTNPKNTFINKDWK